MAIYTLVAIAVALLVFLGALTLVDAAVRGHRQLKFAPRPERRHGNL